MRDTTCRKHHRSQPASWRTGNWLIFYHWSTQGNVSPECILNLNNIQDLVSNLEKITYKRRIASLILNMNLRNSLFPAVRSTAWKTKPRSLSINTERGIFTTHKLKKRHVPILQVLRSHKRLSTNTHTSTYIIHIMGEEKLKRPRQVLAIDDMSPISSD